MEFTGKVIARSEKREGVGKNGNHWSMISYVLQEEGVQYPKKISMEIFGDDRVNAIMNTKVGGKMVTAHFDIDAAEYNGSWYNRIRCYRMIMDGQDIFPRPINSQNNQSANTPQQQNNYQPTPQQVSSAPANSGNMGQGDAFPPEEPQNDDLPF